MNALETGVFSIDRGQVMHERAVASHAIVLQDFRPPLGNKDRFMEILKRKPLRMAVPIVGFSDILGRKRLRQMALDAGGGGVVAGLLPRIK